MRTLLRLLAVVLFVFIVDSGLGQDPFDDYILNKKHKAGAASGGGGGGISIIQHSINMLASGAGAESFTAPTTTTANHLLVVISFSNYYNATSVTDNLSQTWTCGIDSHQTARMMYTSLCYVANSAAGVTTITVTQTGAVGGREAGFYEVAGIATSSPLDVSGVENDYAQMGTFDGGSTPSSPITTTQSNEICITGLRTDGAGYTPMMSITSGGFTINDTSDGFPDTQASKILSATGSQQAVWGTDLVYGAYSTGVMACFHS